MEESDSSLVFLRDLLHELKDPFAAVYGGLELTGRSSPLTGSERDRLETSLKRNSQAMKKVLDDASLYLRVVSGGGASPPTATDAESVLREAAEDSRPQLETRAQTVSVVAPANLSFQVDKEALRRCLGCMLGSVSRVCSHGEVLELRLAPPSDGQIEVRLTVSGREQRPGGERGDFRESLAHVLAGLLRGVARRTSLDSWTLTFPFHPAEQVGVARPAASRPRRATRILVVDDNRDGADTLSMWLEARGYQVSTAYDGDSGWEQFQRLRPDIGLFDVGLPGRNGYELARALREAGFGGSLVAITGYGQEQDRAQALGAGFDHHLVKPVDLQSLGALLEMLRSPHVLVVEDNPVARQVLSAMLGKLGARVTGVGTGEEGLEAATRESLDLVICDLGLPGELSGYDLARRLRQDQTLSCALVALTGDAAVAREEALKSGFDQVLEKPADVATLSALLGL